MERYLRPERFDGDPQSQNGEAEWLHWKRTFDSFLASVAEHTPNQLDTLINFVSPKVYAYISDSGDYNSAITTLAGLFVKKKNKVFARYKLNSRKQQPGESLDEFVQDLKLLSKNCAFTNTTVAENQSNYLVDALIGGLASNQIRQRLLEKDGDVTFDAAYTLARSLDSAASYASDYLSTPASLSSAAAIDTQTSQPSDTVSAAASSSSSSLQHKCSTCTRSRHAKGQCPARFLTCHKCHKKGHFSGSSACDLTSSKKAAVSFIQPALTSLISIECTSAADETKSKDESCGSVSYSQLHSSYNQGVLVDVEIFGDQEVALADSGATESFIANSVVVKHNVKITPSSTKVCLASGQSSDVVGECRIDIKVMGKSYRNFKFTILQNLVAPVILGYNWFQLFDSVTFHPGGDHPGISLPGVPGAAVGALDPMIADPPKVFNFHQDVKPVATKSRKFSSQDFAFIKQEVEKLLKDGIIEESHSPWRAQVLVVRDPNHKVRMVVDYSRTVNRYTSLDAYPMKNIDALVQLMAKYSVYSSFDLTHAYYQVLLHPEDKEFTAFQAGSKLYQFLRLPFGLKNAVAAFQRLMDKFIEVNQLTGVYAYVDNIYVGGHTQEEHDTNVQRLMEAAKKCNFTFNEGKTILSTQSLPILGYLIKNKNILPDPDRVKPLVELPVPSDMPGMKRVIGMFAYFSKFIPKFSDRINPLVKASKFPLSPEEVTAFKVLKDALVYASLGHIDEDIPFVLETDASNVAISAVLTQNGCPVGFHSRTFHGSELGHSSVEKEAHAIVDAVKKWDYLLLGKNFTIVTDQQPVSYMFSTEHSSRIKNAKIARWRVELSQFDYNITYRAGKDNVAADMFTRAYCSAISTQPLVDSHQSLCHPGVTRFLHFVRSRNLPYSVEDVRRITQACKICSEVKPRFYRSAEVHVLIKATAPWERLNLDFKGPLPSSTRNKYLLTVIDEFSRFAFAFPCSDISASTVINCLNQLFTIFGIPSYTHSDRGAQFMSNELKQFLHGKGVVTSRTTAYNPRGNGQCERYNGIIWKTVLLALKNKDLPTSQWETVLPDALHAVRSLLCTSINATPHEKFFSHPRRSCSGTSMPSWLMSQGPVWLRKHVRRKSDPLVEEVTLLDANPKYAHIKYQDGRETTVSLRDLAPQGLESHMSGDVLDLVEEDSEDNHSESHQEVVPSSRVELQNTPPLMEVAVPPDISQMEAVVPPQIVPPMEAVVPQQMVPPMEAAVPPQMEAARRMSSRRNRGIPAERLITTI